MQLVRDVLRDMGRIVTFGVLDKDDEPRDPRTEVIAARVILTVAFFVIFAIWYWG